MKKVFPIWISIPINSEILDLSVTVCIKKPNGDLSEKLFNYDSDDIKKYRYFYLNKTDT